LTKVFKHIYAVAEEVIRSSLCAPPREHIEKLQTTLNQSDGCFYYFHALVGNGDELDKANEHDDD